MQYDNEKIAFEIIDSNGVILDLKDKDKFFIKEIDGLDHPAIRMNTGVMAGRDGSFLGRQRYEGRYISVTGFFRCMGENEGRTPDQMYSARQEFIDVVSRFVNPVTVKIYEKLDSGLVRIWRCIGKLVNFNSPTGNTGVTSIEFELELRSEFPYIESNTLNSLVLNEATIRPGDRIPDRIPDRIGVMTESINTLINNGSVFAYPLIRLTGKMLAPIIITNTTTGKYIKYDDDITLIEAVEIDMWDKTVIKNGSVNMIAQKSGDWLELAIDTNIFLYTFGVGSTGNVTVYWRDLKLGL